MLRAVSHDLRTPVTAIVAAGHALGSDSLTAGERTELSAAVVEEGEQLAALVDKLLDLSRLQAGRAEPRRDWVSLEDVVLAARDGLVDSGGEVRLSIDADVPPVRADAAHLERAFANLIENALRYSGGQPVSVRVSRSGSRAVVRVVDQGPGIPPADRARIFEPFYRGTTKPASHGAAPASDSRSRRGSSRPTAGRSPSTRCPVRGRASWSRYRSSSPRLRVRTTPEPAAPLPR